MAMTEISQEALDAAAAELGRQFHGGAPDPDDIKLASDVLLAAAPLIAATERERIRQGLNDLARRRAPFVYFGRDIAAVLDDDHDYFRYMPLVSDSDSTDKEG